VEAGNEDKKKLQKVDQLKYLQYSGAIRSDNLILV
jgi:hypothetical protein